jgi:hypothetical protein
MQYLILHFHRSIYSYFLIRASLIHHPTHNVWKSNLQLLLFHVYEKYSYFHNSCVKLRHAWKLSALTTNECGSLCYRCAVIISKYRYYLKCMIMCLKFVSSVHAFARIMILYISKYKQNTMSNVSTFLFWVLYLCPLYLFILQRIN